MLKITGRASAFGDIPAQREYVIDSRSLKSTQQTDYIVFRQADARQMGHALDTIFILDL